MRKHLIGACKQMLVGFKAQEAEAILIMDNACIDRQQEGQRSWRRRVDENGCVNVPVAWMYCLIFGHEFIKITK